jgi:cytoskeletal protein CcmA (bactofilin family)
LTVTAISYIAIIITIIQIIALKREIEKREVQSPCALLTLLLSPVKFQYMTDVHNDILEDEDFDTVLSPDINFSGTLNFEKPFLIRGKLSGDIIARGLLVVDEEAVVEANINASRVVIRGSVKGNVTASEKVEVTITGKLAGNVTAPEIFMETGCVFNGRCTMTERKL